MKYEYYLKILLIILQLTCIHKLIDNIIEKTADIRKQYSDKYPVYMHLLEKNLYQDLTYILKWFNIDMDIKDTIHKLK